MKEYTAILAVLIDLERFAQINELEAMKLAIIAARLTAVSELAALSEQRRDSQVDIDQKILHS